MPTKQKMPRFAGTEMRNIIFDLALLFLFYILATSLFALLDISESIISFLHDHYEHLELDDILLASLFILPVCMFLFAYRRWQDTRRLTEQANFDPLTGALNRRVLGHILNRELDRAEQFGRPLSLIMFDIDHFKEINDSCGHQAGDAALQGVIRLVLNELRSTDVVARWGGEEFVIVMVETPIEQAEVMAEKIRRRLSKSLIPGVDRNITASFGVANFSRHTTVDELIQAADQRLYLAKNAGRNRVVSG